MTRSSRPTPSPETEVREQLDALRHNDVPEPDTGLAMLYAFTAIHEGTAESLESFIRDLKEHELAPLIDHRYAVQDPVRWEGNRASQVVHVAAKSGEVAAFRFDLILLNDGETTRWRMLHLARLDGSERAMVQAAALARHFLN